LTASVLSLLTAIRVHPQSRLGKWPDWPMF